jgi:alpha-tubulin suppressor-like RCC1 family protein
MDHLAPALSTRSRRRPSTIVLVGALVVSGATFAPAAPARADAGGVPTALAPIPQRISAGTRTTCTVDLAGRVVCWGDGAHGALGYGSTSTVGDDETPAQNTAHDGFVPMPGGRRAVAVAVGNSDACALLESGDVTCWGDGSSGALGYGNTNDIGDDETPAQNPVNGGIVPLPGGSTAIQITAGNHFACALLVDHRVTCWGSGGGGELGYGNTNNIGDDETAAQNPVDGGIVSVPGGRAVVQVAAGSGSVCALLVGGDVTCWGFGGDGRLGYGNTSSIGDDEKPSQNPANGGIVRVTAVIDDPVRAISVGSSAACAVLDDEHLVCWGSGALGQLGYGSTSSIGDDETPAQNPLNGGFVPVPAGGRVQSVDVGLTHVCVVTKASGIACWGAGVAGELGYGNTNTIGDNETPAQNPVNGGLIPSISYAESVVTGGFFTCATVVGYVACWGVASGGQLGYGNTNPIGDNEVWNANPVNSGVVPLPKVVAPDGLPSTGVSQIAVDPARLMDTRQGLPTVDGLGGGGGPLAAGETRALAVMGRGGIPKIANSITINVAVTGTTTAGYLTIYACNDQRPLTSNLNWLAGQTIANGATVRIAVDGTICIYASAPAHVVVDVQAYQPGFGMFGPTVPERLLDTRPGFVTVDGLFQGAGLLQAGTEIALTIEGRPEVANAAAALVNVAVTEPVAAGFITVHPCGTPRPNAANLNYVAGQTISNTVFVGVGTVGKICIYSHATTHVVVDLDGWMGRGADQLHAVQPSRLVDTRAGYTTIDGQFQAQGALGAGQEIALQVSGRAGVPTLATSVVLNVTAVGPSAGGYVTAYPCGTPRPTVSSLNYGAGDVIANAVTVKIGAGGKVCLFSFAGTDLVADLDAYAL